MTTTNVTIVKSNPKSRAKMSIKSICEHVQINLFSIKQVSKTIIFSEMLKKL